MRMLLVGDVFAEAGMRCVERLVPQLRRERAIDVVVANGENAARGVGITDAQVRRLLGWGVDGITLGNHAFRQREVFPVLSDASQPVVRPANLPARAPGRGLMYLEAHDGPGGHPVEVAVLNLMGQVNLDTGASPWEVVDGLVDQALARTRIVVVDMHAEATSEKVAMGIHLAGRATVVAGTHTHVQTSDARILDGHTACITDLGMTGPHGDSVIGVRSDIIIRRFTTGIGERFVPGAQGVQLEGAIIDIDVATGRATSIEAIRVPMP